jgi:hypothetical protein
MKRLGIFTVLTTVLVASCFYLVKTLYPKIVKAANFTSASATLVNSRYSYKAGVASGTSGSSLVTIDGSGNADNTTNHLFPGDVVCFTDVLENGCIGNKNYTVANILAGGTTFNLTSPLTDNLLSDGYVVASASGALTLTFTTTSVIPIGGDLYITIPTVNTTGKTNDDFPDTAATTALNGFDQGKMLAGDITAPASNCTQWGTMVITPGDSSNDLRIQLPKATATCAAGSALTMIIGGTTHALINPAPLLTHTQGQADSYQINIKSRDGSGNTIDSSDVTVAPVEGVLVSATVDETLSLTVAGITIDSGTYCGISRSSSSPDTSATSVPWGTISPTYASATHNTQQQVTVSTNAKSGYSVFIEENDQMGKDGNTCTGTDPSPGDYTFGTGTCIRDTVCQASACSQTTETDWTNMGSFVGFGFSLEDQSGTDAVFEWDDGGTTFKARQIADVTQGGETRAAIMTNAGPVSGSSAYVCYRIAISGLQPAGYYYNKVRYTAIPIF